MMMRTFMASLAVTAALGLAMPTYAQVTDQTDQSEEDWRKSRKKSGSSDIYRTPDTRSTGAGSIDITPLTPVERLPSESRRHLMKERARAIAESDDGDISDAEYVPSDAAKTDEALARQEQEAWDMIITDAQGSSGQGSSQGGPNKVAVAGQGNGSAPSGSRGGSTRTLQEIMDSIKNGQMGGGGSGQTGDGSGTGSPSGQDGAEPGDGQSGSDGSENGSGQNQGSDGASNGTDQGDGEQSGSDGTENGADRANGSDSSNAANRAQEPLSPLERMRRNREERPAEGSQRSASDYLGKKDG